MAASFENRPAGQPDLAPILVGLARRHGSAVLGQRARLHGLLRDYAPTALREIRLLLAALDVGAPSRLQAAADPVAPALLAAEAGRMADEFGCERSFALQAAETWGRATLALRAPQASLPPPRHAPAVSETLAPPPAPPLAYADQPSWFGRWGGVLIAALLAFVALARWLGLV
ncbi:hypothetical protein [Enterovirga rhinocerotis]|uniref:Uncharacterized protein n=1 Tax=Enterovirga rhinocerotis TaxID=1339210 RepID=A0A4R7BTV3_9HYPH|nr:hypothetical protein [Enterovirga rhinocerotis]TDR89188.1 hypothetical protein EV668_3677 [Enterovirga rhinocerotis]